MLTSVNGSPPTPELAEKLHEDFHRECGAICGDHLVQGWAEYPEAFFIHYGSVVVTVTRHPICVPCAIENCEETE